MPTDIDQRMREIRERRDEVRVEQEQKDEPENDDVTVAEIAKVNGALQRDMSGETFRDSYFQHSASALRRRALRGSNGHSVPRPKRPIKDWPQA